ncbi:uncharacterized protein LOC143294305 [Babylonia areolata]|uniref:uncharacterized protein LOC143294305 n=1 Tax=Babylonia areolata TaxID=304850 RepID=UPI003FD66632
MASTNRSVCYSFVFVLFASCLLPFSSSSDNKGDLLEYSLVDNVPANKGPAIHVEAFHPVRAKRQALPSTPSTPSNSTAESSQVTQASTLIPITTTAGDTTVNTNMNTTAAPAPTTTAAPVPQPTLAPDTTTVAAQPTTVPVMMTTTTSTNRRTTQGIQSTTSTLPPIITENDHSYYKSTIIPGAADDYFVPLYNPLTHESLNSAHRLAGVISLPMEFNFRFYGHKINSITVATGGFIYMSPFVHRFLASTQYTAPLMANFHTAASNDSNIYFQHVGDEFIVEWQNILLKGEEEKGPFTFQAKLKSDGTITFVYKKLPVPITNITSESHPVKIGLSDAFYNDTHVPEEGIIRRRIVEYHRVVIGIQMIEQGTVVILTPLPTCNTIEDCETCAVHDGVKFDCKWCSSAKRCSSGLDWYRQDWEKKGCTRSAHTDPFLCNLTSTTPIPSSSPGLSPVTPKSTINTSIQLTSTVHPVTTTLRHVTTTTTTSRTTTATSSTTNPTSGLYVTSGAVHACQNGSCRSKNPGVAAAVTVCVLLALLLVIVGVWVYYAYTHPTSRSGIWLMEHRPSLLRAKLASMSCCKKNPPQSSKYAMESTA